VKTFIYVSSDRARRCFDVPAGRQDVETTTATAPIRQLSEAQPRPLSPRRLAASSAKATTRTWPAGRLLRRGDNSGQPRLEPVYSILLVVASVADGKLGFELRWPATSGEFVWSILLKSHVGRPAVYIGGFQTDLYQIQFGKNRVRTELVLDQASDGEKEKRTMGEDGPMLGHVRLQPRSTSAAF
jgi:hypothetical protein